MNPSTFFVPAAVAATVVAAATLAYAQNNTTSPTATHPAVQVTPAQPMPADSTTSPTATHPAMQGTPGQPMPADSTTPTQGGTSTTGGMSSGPSTTKPPSTGTPTTATSRVVPAADGSSMVTERPAVSDRN